MEECKICMTVNHLFPIACPGGHKYCLSCIKGLSLSSSPSGRGSISCPTCRHPLPRNYCNDICNDSRQIHEIDKTQLFENILNKDHIWLYEGRNNGWWCFDYEMQDMLEEAHNNEDQDFDWYICGQRIIIDFSTMEQHNTKNNAVRKIQRIKSEDIGTLLIKGVGGMMPQKQ